MPTALHIINRAFSKIRIRASETPIEASEAQDALDVLNGILKRWNATGELKGASPVLAITDTLTIPDYAEDALKAQVAIILAGEYGVQVTQALAADLTDSMRTMLTMQISLDNVDMPATLPVGSENYDDFDSTDLDFFPEHPKNNF